MVVAAAGPLVVGVVSVSSEQEMTATGVRVRRARVNGRRRRDRMPTILSDLAVEGAIENAQEYFLA
jgi:hypothetical protein